MTDKKTAVIVFSIGGPDKPESIAPFLKNFFSDPNIISLPQPLRGFLARRIAGKRAKNEAGSAYAALGGKSPLLENTQAQATALEAVLGAGYKVFVCMRYWHPMSPAVVAAVRDYAPDEIVLLPLYPQYSTTTSFSSLTDWQKQAGKQGLNAPVRAICCYPLDPGFINASATLVNETLFTAQQKNPNTKFRVLFSAHGLPERVIKSGDPYQWQCEESAKAIATTLGLRDWQICYQSRVGPLKWIGPSTEDALEQAAKDKVGVVVYPHAFVSEHVETLVEIEAEYREMAEKLGVPAFARVPTVSTQPDFIAGLARLVTDMAGCEKICPGDFKRCWCVTEGLKLAAS